MTDTFLSPADLATLTGLKRKSLQIDALRRMGIPFWINIRGVPVVARSAIEGGRVQTKIDKVWKSAHG